MDILPILSAVALLAGAGIALTQKAWPVALLCAGLALAALADASLIVG
jgi:hypothetical protein